MLTEAGACLSSLRDYQGFVSPTTGWHPWLMNFMPSALSARGATMVGHKLAQTRSIARSKARFHPSYDF